MYVVLTVLLILVSLFILAIVLVQNPKGSGTMGSAFGGAASNIIGVQKAGDTMERLTWGAALLLLILSFGTTFFLPTKGTSSKSKIELGTVNAPVPAQQPNAVPGLTLPATPAPAETPAPAPQQ